ncbi:uncharacterized protein LOC134846929 isoform X3 [Symsagittifera roscoffensis]|uniref:uncharacterized protein LOC134846929 isoform X3 n=1 Tax=Symsagittifera roscoffensis TaxID=84072 RepID=UPI00307BA916
MMASPTFQKNGAYAGNVSNPHAPRKPVPTLVFRQKSSRPLLLNSQSLASNFKAVTSGDRSSANRFKNMSSRNVPVKSQYASAVATQPVVHTDSASYTPLAQYFTFTGRLNPVRDGKSGKEVEGGTNDVINKLESVSYKLKLNQDLQNGDAHRDEHSKDVNVEEDLKNHTNGFIEETDTQKTFKSEEQQCFHYFEPHLHAGKNNKHGRAEETQPRIGGANENGVVEFVEWDSRYAGGDNQLLKVGKGQRPQSAAVSYALHRQTPAKPDPPKRPSSSCSSAMKTKPVAAVVNSSPNPFLRPVPIMPPPSSHDGVFSSHSTESSVAAGQNGTTKVVQNGTLKSSNFARGVSVFNSRAAMVQPQPRPPRYNSSGTGQTSTANQNQQPVSDHNHTTNTLNLTSSTTDLSRIAGEKVSYLQRINSGSAHMRLQQQQQQQQQQNLNNSSATGGQSVDCAKQTDASTNHRMGAKHHFVVQKDNRWEVVADSSTLADSSLDRSSLQLNQNHSQNTNANHNKPQQPLPTAPSQTDKPVQPVRPMLRTDHVSHNQNTSQSDHKSPQVKTKDSNSSYNNSHNNNAVVVKVMKKQSVGNSESHNSQKMSAKREHSDKMGGGNVANKRSSSSESQNTNSLGGTNTRSNTRAKLTSRNQSVNRKSTTQSSASGKTIKQQSNVTNGGEVRKGKQQRLPLADLEQMHNQTDETDVNNNSVMIAPMGKDRLSRPDLKSNGRGFSRARSSTRENSRADDSINRDRDNSSSLVPAAATTLRKHRSESLRHPTERASQNRHRKSTAAADRSHHSIPTHRSVSQTRKSQYNPGHAAPQSNLLRGSRSKMGLNRSSQLSISCDVPDDDDDEDVVHSGNDEDDEEDDVTEDFEDDGADFEDDEMNSLDDDDASAGRLSACSSYSNLSRLGHGESDEGEEDDDDEDESKTAVTSLSRSRAQSGVGREMVPNEEGLLPALWPSLFKYIPPTIFFHLKTEKVAVLPHDARKLLKWKPSTICPNVVKNLIARVGFKFSKSSTDIAEGNSDWICYWGKHMKAECFRNVKEYQKVNHFPGTFQIGRKDKLYRNLTRLQSRYGQKHFNFFPNTFVLPVDLRLLKRCWDDGGYKNKWILKPPASARGIGIKVINKWNQIPKRRAVLVQRYINKPFLINGSKFDLRIYCFVSSYDPLRVYVYNNGLARFCSMKYSSSVKNISNKFMHLTNYSVNKFNSDYLSNDSSTKCEGHKWTLQALWGWMDRRGIDHRKIWNTIQDIVVKTIIASDHFVSSATKANLKNRRSCYELFGFDIILDDNLKPWILEVNISPSLHSNSELDISVKENMLRDLFNVLGLTVPDKEEVASANMKCKFKLPYMKDGKFIRDAQLTQNERAKHVHYMQRASDEVVKSTILDILTAEDIRLLAETEDEMNRAGDFVRVFPAINSTQYLRYFDQPAKYANLLLDEWARRYAYMPQRGIEVLEHLCAVRAHLGERDDLCKWSPTLGNNTMASMFRLHPQHTTNFRATSNIATANGPNSSRSRNKSSSATAAAAETVNVNSVGTKLKALQMKTEAAALELESQWDLSATSQSKT